MKARIHPTAIVDKNADIDDDVEIGPFSIIGPQVKIGKSVKIASNVIIDGRTTIGKNCLIFHSAVIGTIPQDLKYDGKNSEVIIGNGTTIREFATINRSTSFERPTKIGNNCLLMNYVHIAHDCQLGENVILANSVNLAGHVTIEERATIGGITPIHQFVKIGCYSFIGGMSRINKDVAPYTRGAGVPFKTVGLNSVGLVRNNFPEGTRALLKKVYKIFYNSDLNTTQAVNKIKKEIEMINEVKHFVDFVESSERGIAK
ncbi:MAG: acyl-ACP--UDP-N-acetylglucosamine O-acyltransferase [Candidatus Cloacimonetes bacterium]|nr:acyl-ACP--UDP-N-acetylglucosamine O-acyltransferase [Candidatus Cloacimonadota bacterium]MBL7085772.1 acyl-ACP--UDP-N-acetylglucosamine O-acyltransferase [Candidatus Cloacimonadota bacterium]